MTKLTLFKLILISTATLVSTSIFANQTQMSSQTTPLYLADQSNSEQPSDTSITTNVKSSFLKEKLFGDADISAMTIHVKTTRGHVLLTGTADNQAQIDTAVSLAQKVEGVKKVTSEVKVKKNSDSNNSQ